MTHGRPFRLPNYDYSQSGCYFVTFCTKDRAPVLSRISMPSDNLVGRDAYIAAPLSTLLPAGRILNQFIRNIPKVYDDVILEHYVIMPNHVHLLLTIGNNNAAMLASRPTDVFGLTRTNPISLSSIVRSLKILTTKKYGQAVFQPSFHEHIIRNESDYLQCWQYIDNNPAKWTLDRYYSE